MDACNVYPYCLPREPREHPYTCWADEDDEYLVCGYARTELNKQNIPSAVMRIILKFWGNPYPRRCYVDIFFSQAHLCYPVKTMAPSYPRIVISDGVDPTAESIFVDEDDGIEIEEVD